MNQLIRSLALAALVLTLTLGTVGAQEPAQGCESLPGAGSKDQPVMIVTDNGPNFNLTVWTVQGCRFEANQTVALEGSLKLGTAAPKSLAKLDVKTDSNGQFKAEFRYDGQPSDFDAGYEFRLVANGAGAKNESAGSIGMPGGGGPQVPSAGAGGASPGTNPPLVAALSLLAIASLALAFRGAVR